MKKTLKQSNMVANAIELALAECPAPLGRKLAPEIQIAKKLKISRTMIRSAIGILEDKGYLSRKRGSGTFISKDITSIDIDENNIHMKISPDIIFSEEFTGTQRNQIKTVGFYSSWKGNDDQTAVPQTIINGILQGADEKNYRMVINRIHDSSGNMFSPNEIKDKMRNTPSNGLIASYTWKDILEQACPDSTIPRLYYYTQELELCENNLVTFATGKAIELSVEIFANQGITDIGLITYASNAEIVENSYAKQYERAMRLNSLTYRKVIKSIFSFKYLFDQFKEMQATSTLPQALYIADDRLMIILKDVFDILKIIPGKDIAIISHANLTPEQSVPDFFSCMAFDPYLFGETIVDCIDKLMKKKKHTLPGLLIMPEWHENESHILKS